VLEAAKVVLLSRPPLAVERIRILYVVALVGRGTLATQEPFLSGRSISNILLILTTVFVKVGCKSSDITARLARV
jgi:hypothetical protein